MIHGQQIGHTIGYPTANIEVAEEFKLIEKSGVYATFADIDGKSYASMTYIGKRPTMQDNKPQSIETHIFSFTKDIYGEEIKLRFVDFVRDDVRFEDITALKEQLDKDKSNIINILNQTV